MKRFFVVTAVMEAGAGLGLLIAPAPVLRLLFGAADIQTGVALARVAGAALVSLGAAAWWARDDHDSPASRALASGLLIYNTAIVALVLTGTLGALDPVLWALVAVHGAMAVWCVMVATRRAMRVHG